MRYAKSKAILFLFVLLTAALSRATDISEGDIFITKTGRDYTSLYQLHRKDNYAPEFIIQNCHEPLFDIDRSRQRIYFCHQRDKFYYLDLNAEPRVLKKVDFIPADMRISSVAGDGSCLILYKKVYDDIYAEENPFFQRPYGGMRFYMLFRYDMATGEITRLTYFHSQKYSWVSPDGRCLAYKRYSEVLRVGKFDETIIFCRIDGMLKYDLAYYFAEVGLDLNEYEDFERFALKLNDEELGRPGYHAVFRPYDYPEGEITDKIEYYLVTLFYEGDKLRCEVKRKRIYLPAGMTATGIWEEVSSAKEIYLGGSYEDGRGGLIRYDVDTRTFNAIPTPEGSGEPFLVY